MHRSNGGYTIVEIMIFLSVSAVIFIMATLVFQGQQGKTQFEQGMHDLASQLQLYVDQVSTTIFSGSQYSCSTQNSAGRAKLSSSGGTGTGTNQDCIFLGRAIQVIPNQSKIFIYSVLGNATSNGDAVTSFAGSLPEPAIPDPTTHQGPDLTEEYDLPWGTVKSGSSTITYAAGGTTNSDLVSFYNSLQDGYQSSGAGGGQSITARGYNWPDSSSTLASVRGPDLKNCLEEQGSCANTQAISTWTICFVSAGSSQTARLEIASTPAGITTNTNFTSC